MGEVSSMSAAAILSLVALGGGGDKTFGDALSGARGWLALCVRATALCFSRALAICCANSGTVVLVETHMLRMISACFLLILDALPVFKLYSAQSQATVSRILGPAASATPDLFKFERTSL